LFGWIGENGVYDFNDLGTLEKTVRDVATVGGDREWDTESGQIAGILSVIVNIIEKKGVIVPTTVYRIQQKGTSPLTTPSASFHLHSLGRNIAVHPRRRRYLPLPQTRKRPRRILGMLLNANDAALLALVFIHHPHPDLILDVSATDDMYLIIQPVWLHCEKSS